MKNVLKYIFSLSLMLCIMASCIDEYNADLGDSDSNILVVEGNIFSDEFCQFYLTHSIGINEDGRNTGLLYINDATLRVVGSDGSSYESVMVNNGYQRGYGVQVGTLKPDVKYSLEITWDGATFTTEPAAPLQTPKIDSMRFSQDSITGQVDIMVTEEVPNSKDPIYLRWLFDETWEIHSHYRPAFAYDLASDKMRPIREEEKKFIGWKYGSSPSIIVGNSAKFDNNHIRDFRIQSIAVNDDRLEQLYCIDVKQYAMSKAQYEYELARREISDEMGGIFAPLPSELFTNISCSDKKHRAIGYVGVGMLQRGQLWINSQYVYYKDALSRFVAIITDEEMLKLSSEELYKLGNRIVDDTQPMDGVWHWASARGVDVTLRGASLERPEWWHY